MNKNKIELVVENFIYLLIYFGPGGNFIVLIFQAI